MVLNSLTSPGMVAVTLSTLGRGAKFAEIGKRDIWSPARVAQERPDVRCCRNVIACCALTPGQGICIRTNLLECCTPSFLTGIASVCNHACQIAA